MLRSLLVALAATFALSAHAAPLEAYGQLPTLQQVMLSPDGSKLALVRQIDEMRVIRIEETTGGKPLGEVNLHDQKLRGLNWAGPNHLSIVTSVTAAPKIGNYTLPKSELLQLQIYDVAAGTFRAVPNLKDVPRFVTDEPEYRLVDGRPTLFVPGYTLVEGARQSLFQIDVETGAAKALDTTSADQRVRARWTVGPDGELLARADYNGVTGEWALMLRSQTGWRTVDRQKALVWPPRVRTFGTKPGTLLGFRLEDEKPVYRLVSLSDGTWGERVPLANDIRALLLDDTTQLIVGVTEGTDRPSTRFLDPKEQAAWERTVRAFKGDIVTFHSSTADRKAQVVEVEGGANGIAYALVNRDSGTAEIIGQAYPGLSADDVVQPQWISYRAADGLELTAILTLPEGRDPKKLPLVVLPHGGPQDRNVVQFHWWAQALASRGYAVLQPNFRGSGGFGPTLVAAGYGQWGRKMQSDVSDSVRDLVAKEIADPQRVCVVGADYGGYVALAGVTLEQGVYKCAVSVAGISDLGAQILWLQSRTPGKDSADLRRMRQFLGVERGGEKALDAISPVTHAARATVPILLIHGKDDLIVPHDQSRRMANARTATGQKPELVTLPGEDHWLSRSETRLQMLKATVEFLERHNPPQ